MESPNPAIPQHVAIIMDGNGRWAKQRLLPRHAGHAAGIRTVRSTIRYCLQQGVQVLTLFAFSSENWRRPNEEVSMLMNLFIDSLARETRQLHESGVRLRVIGDTSMFDVRLRKQITESEALMSSNDQMTLMVAANYGGRWDILQATRKLAQRVAAGELSADAIDDQAFEAALASAGLPEPDLFIRTGGEQRISNFLLWQLAYTELYFTEALWPEFSIDQLKKAFNAFAQRERRFGHTSEQLTRA